LNATAKSFQPSILQIQFVRVEKILARVIRRFELKSDFLNSIDVMKFSFEFDDFKSLNFVSLSQMSSWNREMHRRQGASKPVPGVSVEEVHDDGNE
jgi:hypothetical protein